MLDECLRSEVGEELYQKVWDHDAWRIAHGLSAVWSCNDHCCCDRRELRSYMYGSIRMYRTLLIAYSVVLTFSNIATFVPGTSIDGIHRRFAGGTHKSVSAVCCAAGRAQG
jgi:hypothetical protein